MFYKSIITILSALVMQFHVSQPGQILSPLANAQEKSHMVILASHQFSLTDRYPVPSVNKVFADNILLTLSYFSGNTKQGQKVDWSNVRKPFTYTIKLNPGEVFAFHNKYLPSYSKYEIITSPILFGASDGFESDGYLYGDGVCHLASILNWTAQNAGLNVYAPTNHNFANIPQVPKKYGVSIYTDGQSDATSELQNLYIQNNKKNPVYFIFVYQNNTLRVLVSQIS